MRIAPAVVPLLLLVSCAGAGAPAAASRPPATLNALEAGSEDVGDQVAHDRWERVDRAVHAMRRDFGRYERTGRSVDAAETSRVGAALVALRLRSAARDPLATRQAANDVSAPVVELLAHYRVPTPVQVGRLDVIGRQVAIDVSRGSFDAAGRSADAARVQWATIRAAVRRRDASVAARVEATLHALDTAVAASDGPATTNGSNDLLELVDAVERLY